MELRVTVRAVRETQADADGRRFGQARSWGNYRQLQRIAHLSRLGPNFSRLWPGKALRVMVRAVLDRNPGKSISEQVESVWEDY